MILATQPPKSQGQVTVSLEALLAQLAELRKYIDAIQAQINQVSAELTEIKSSEDAIAELKTKSPDEILAPADRRGHVMIRAQPVSKDKVVAHIGLNYYAEVSLEKATEILLTKEKELKNVLNELQNELARVVNYYQQLEAIVNSAVAQARVKQPQK